MMFRCKRFINGVRQIIGFMAGILSKCTNAVKSGIMACSAVFSLNASASEFKVLHGAEFEAEVSHTVKHDDRINGYGHLFAKIGLVSYGNFSLDAGIRLMNYLRRIDNFTAIQPDKINYDLWPEISYSNGDGKFSLSYFHQCMHDIDETNPDLVTDARTHNIIRMDYERRFDVLEGLETKVGLGPYTIVRDSGYSFFFNAEERLSLFKLTRNSDLYVRGKQMPVLSARESGSFVQLWLDNEVGVGLDGGKVRGELFLKHQRLEDYLKFDTGSIDLFFFGVRFR